MSSDSGSSHRPPRKGFTSSTGNSSDQQSYHSDSSGTRPRRSVITRREEACDSSREVRTINRAQASISDQPQQSESLASNEASHGGSSHNTSYKSENGSIELEAQSYEFPSQHSFSHLDHFSYDALMLSHYENHLTIEEDPNDQHFTHQPATQYLATVLAIENGIYASNNEIYALQPYSPTTEMWTLQESRDERIRLGLPGGQETSMTSLDCDHEAITEERDND